MFSVVVSACLLACLAQAHPTYYRPFYHERSHYIEENRGDKNGFREYDQGSNNQRHKFQASHGASEHEDGQSHSLRDRIKKNKYDEAAHDSKHSSGGKEEHVKKSHDKGFYEKEKHYGYEKSYGYERETKSHDKGSISQGHKSGYEQNESKGNRKTGEQFLRDLAEDAKKFNRGSQSHGSKGEIHESSSHHSIGKEIESELDAEFRRPHFQFAKRSGPISGFAPNFVPRQYMFGMDDSFQRFRLLSGIHGLGGIRVNALGFGYNPLRYKLLEDHMDSKRVPLSELHFDIEHPASRVLYFDHDL
ncbi:hypothetical protein HNY73_011803 [Argiope bruennichi]|uniref:Uncharacterized protein n=1 Tax=Argiope bruennichi TaxID=94029 RepID=A0A8T0ESZ2_ARGBR|nr:hypothetical protein HNY73_011803 [Argiope bruennichi]